MALLILYSFVIWVDLQRTTQKYWDTRNIKRNCPGGSDQFLLFYLLDDESVPNGEIN